ncbi:hypothetical protein GCM10010279_02120 [Streptomyces mutabilis]|nr:hypothetical protein GCM10010279_02120 [Streptomyces mutabilis]
MQKSTGPAPASPPLSRVSAAIDGLCAAVLRNNEVTLPDKWTSVCGRPARGSAGRPYIRRSGAGCSTRVKKVCPHASNEWTVVVR